MQYHDIYIYIYIYNFQFSSNGFFMDSGIKKTYPSVSSGHGTGTALGDPIEVGAIKAALG